MPNGDDLIVFQRPIARGLLVVAAMLLARVDFASAPRYPSSLGSRSCASGIVAARDGRLTEMRDEGIQVQNFVGWAKRSVPTRGHGAKARLCPPYGVNQIDRDML
jgi:phage terminase large subunit-like protein